MTQLFLDQSWAGIGTGSGQIVVSDSDDINTQFTKSGIVMRPGESDPLPTQEDAFSTHQCSTTGTKNGDAQSLTVMEVNYLGIMNGRFQFSTWDCGMAGAITPIDPRYNLYDIIFENVSCASPNMSFEHTRWKGLFNVCWRNRSTRDIFIGSKPATYWRPGP